MPRVIVRTAVLIFVALSCTACAGNNSVRPRPESAQAGEPRGQLPELEGLPVYDVPIAEAAPKVQDLWALAQDTLTEPFPELAADDGYFESIRTRLEPWIRNRMSKLTKLLRETRKLSAEPRQAMFAAILKASLFDVTVQTLRTMPSPPQSGGKAKMFREAINNKSAFLARAARQAYQQCAGLVDRAPTAMQAWKARCVKRANELKALADRAQPKTAARKKRLPPPPECRHKESDIRVSRPNAPAPDESAARQLAVLYSGDRLKGKDRERFLSIMTDKLARITSLPAVPRAVVRKAERLHQQRRLLPSGPVCGQAPPLPAIIAQRAPNLVLAWVSTGYNIGEAILSPAEPRQHYSLTVHFTRAGSHDRSGLPDFIYEALEEAPSPASWIRLASHLGTRASKHLGGVFGGLGLGGRRGMAFVDVFPRNNPNPWLRVSSTLFDLNSELTRCHPSAGTTSLELSWTISPVGKPSKVAVAPHTVASAADGEAVARCVARILRKSAWPCTPSKKKESVEATLCINRRE